MSCFPRWFLPNFVWCIWKSGATWPPVTLQDIAGKAPSLWALSLKPQQFIVDMNEVALSCWNSQTQRSWWDYLREDGFTCSDILTFCRLNISQRYIQEIYRNIKPEHVSLPWGCVRLLVEVTMWVAFVLRTRTLNVLLICWWSNCDGWHHFLLQRESGSSQAEENG